MVYIALGLGVLLLLALLASARAFATADPASVARFLRWFAISLAGFAGLLLVVYLALSGRLVLDLIPLAALIPVLLRAWRTRRSWFAAGSPQARTSDVETDTLRMRLDHDTGAITGTVRRGPYAGRKLDELAEADLFSLWRHCRADDEPAAQLLEAYLDRLKPDWRAAEAAAGAAGSGPGANGDKGPAGAASDAMTRAEALAILGLTEGADATAVKEAHRGLMMKLHPDHGGTTYLAAKLNRAREILLKD